MIARLANPSAASVHHKDASTNTAGRLLSIMNRCGDSIKVFLASAPYPGGGDADRGLAGWPVRRIIPRQSVSNSINYQGVALG